MPVGLFEGRPAEFKIYNCDLADTNLCAFKMARANPRFGALQLPVCVRLITCGLGDSLAFVRSSIQLRVRVSGHSKGPAPLLQTLCAVLVRGTNPRGFALRVASCACFEARSLKRHFVKVTGPFLHPGRTSGLAVHMLEGAADIGSLLFCEFVAELQSAIVEAGRFTD